MKGDDLNGKKWKIDWGELSIPLLILAFSIAFIVQIIGSRLLSVGFAVFSLAVLVPLQILIIFKYAIRRVEKDEKEEIFQKSKENRLARLNLSEIFSLKASDEEKVKQVRFNVLFVICFGVIGYLFGFHAFTFSFCLLSLLALGVKPIPLFSITLGTTLFMYIIFDRLLMFPLPRGALW